MSENIPGEINESGEQGEKQNKKLVWIVEDNLEYTRSIMMFVKATPNLEADFHYFPTGEEALGQYQQIAEAKGQEPNVILMDYQLDQGVKDPKFRTGVEVINELKRIASEFGIPLPEIVSFSGDDKFAKLLQEAGATSAVEKINVAAFIKRFEKKK